MFDNLLIRPFPVLGKQLNSSNSFNIDLSDSNKSASFLAVKSMAQLGAFINGQRDIQEGQIAVGGYREKRTLYQSFAQFHATKSPREYHLGVDIWTNANTPIYSPYDGKVVISSFIDLDGDYGGVIVVKHEIEGYQFHSLFGHLSKSSIINMTCGITVKTGTQIGLLGQTSENGGWPPHLHLQTILDLGEFTTDYPGVCSLDEQAYYYDNCPNPMWLI